MNLKTVLKNLPTGWAEEAEAMSEDQLRDAIVEAENNARVAREEMVENPGYKAAKEAFDEVKGPLKDAIKAQKAKTLYALHLLEERGKL